MLTKKFIIFIIFLILCIEPAMIKSVRSNNFDTEQINISNVSETTYEEQDEINPFALLMFQRYFLLGWLSLIVIIIGISGNIFTIIVLRHPTMKSGAINIHFTGLAISDLTCLTLILISIPLRYILGNLIKYNINICFLFKLRKKNFYSKSSTTLVS